MMPLETRALQWILGVPRRAHLLHLSPPTRCMTCLPTPNSTKCTPYRVLMYRVSYPDLDASHQPLPFLLQTTNLINFPLGSAGHCGLNLSPPTSYLPTDTTTLLDRQKPAVALLPSAPPSVLRCGLRPPKTPNDPEPRHTQKRGR